MNAFPSAGYGVGRLDNSLEIGERSLVNTDIIFN
jgi:hypothetical protein